MPISKKLTITLICIACVICLSIGIAGCNETQHVHTFAQEWSRDETYHWHNPTCTDTDEVRDYGEHYDDDNNGYCDKCFGAVEHHHSYNTSFWVADGENGHYHMATCEHTKEKGDFASHNYNAEYVCTECNYHHNHVADNSEWKNDERGHWHATTCGHDVKLDFAAHIDEDGDELCDFCDYVVPHVHEMSEEWTISETEHWHVSTCHSEYIEDRAKHTFTEGVCACGVKEIETEVYNIYVAREGSGASTFAEWRSDLQNDGVKDMRITENNDVVYVYDGGAEQVIYVSERTIKVKAVNQNNEPVQNVYVKVTCSINGAPYQNGTTNALAVAATDAEGFAEITFTPVGGFTSQTAKYSVSIAQALDIAAILEVKEENVHPVPNRYTYKDEDNRFAVTISEDMAGDDIVATFNVTYSTSWNAYNKIYIPYHRYYTNPIDAKMTVESGKSFTFTSWGDNLSDYMYFEPYYNAPGFAPYQHPDEADIIRDNSKKVASGVYEISFSVTDGAEATLSYWNENNVDFGLPEYVPSTQYLTSVSGGTAGDGKHTGGNYVTVEVQKEFAMKLFQLGIRTDKKCEVTITVEYKGPVNNDGSTIDWDYLKDNNYRTSVKLNAYGNTTIGLINFEPGIYRVHLVFLNEPFSIGDSDKGSYAIRTNDNAGNFVLLWESVRESAAEHKGIITVTEKTKSLTVYNGNRGSGNFTIEITPCELPVLQEGLNLSAPLARTENPKYELPVDPSVVSGKYHIKISVGYVDDGGPFMPIGVFVGGRTYVLNTNQLSSFYTYEGDIEIKQDEKISLRALTNSQKYTEMVQLTLTKLQ